MATYSEYEKRLNAKHKRMFGMTTPELFAECETLKGKCEELRTALKELTDSLWPKPMDDSETCKALIARSMIPRDKARALLDRIA